MRAFDPGPLPKPRHKEFARAEAFLQRSGPFDLEIGCGVGWHPITYAGTNPARNLIAIEHTRAKFESFEGRIERHQAKGQLLANLLGVHANAVSWVAHCLPEKSLERVFFMYPNPELKRTQQRWHRMPFFGFLLSRLKADGEVYLVTNIEPYARDAFEMLSKEWGLKALTRLGAHYVGPPRTHFEKKYALRGEPLFEIRFQLI